MPDVIVERLGTSMDEQDLPANEPLMEGLDEEAVIAEEEMKAEEARLQEEAEEKARKEEEKKQEEAAAEKEKREEAEQKKKEEAAAAAAKKKAADDAAAEKKKREQEEAQRKADEEKRRKAEEKRVEDEKKKAQAEKEKERKKQEADKAAAERKKNDEKAAAEKKKKQEEEKQKKEEEKKKKDEETKKKKEEETKKREEEKKKKEEEANKKKEEDMKKKEEEMKKKEAEKKKKDEEKKKSEEEAKKKKQAEMVKKEAEKKKLEEEKKKKEEGAKKQKAGEKAKKEAEKKKKEEETKKKKEEEAKKSKDEKEKKEKEKKAAAAKKKGAAKKEEKKKSEKRSSGGGKQQGSKKQSGDEEKGEHKINDRSHVEDTCYSESGLLGCRTYGLIMMLVVFPILYGTALFIEYKGHKWDRIVARSGGHAYGSTTHSFLQTTGLVVDADGNLAKPKDSQPKESNAKAPKPAPAPARAPAPAPAPKTEPKTEPKAEPAPAPKPAPKPEPKDEPKAEPAPAPKRAPKPEPKDEPKAEPAPAPKPAPKPEPKAAEEPAEADAKDVKASKPARRTLLDEGEDKAEATDDEQVSKRQQFIGFAKKNPLVYLLPIIGGLLGLFSNMVPAGFGLALMPLFQELGVTHHSDDTVALTCMLALVTNGVLGFTTWCCRDVRLFVCRALWILSPCIGLGYFVGVTKNLSMKDLFMDMYKGTEDANLRASYDSNDIELLHTYIRLGFGCFMVFMSIWVMIGVCIGGVNRYCCPSKTGGTTPGCKSFCQWIIVMCCCFITGYMFVATIGSGSGITTFFLLSVFLGVETKRALPTAIVLSGWVAALPAYRCIFFAETMPYVTLLMMFPGLWFGSVLAPWFSKCGGPMCDLFLYFLLLCSIGTAVVALAAMKVGYNSEDIEMDIEPMVSFSFVNQYFDEKDVEDAKA